MSPSWPGPEGYVPVVRPRIGGGPARPDPSLLARLRDVDVSDVSDVVGRLYTMDPGIRPLYEPIPPTVGTALTVKAHPGDNLAIHGGLGMADDGDVLVVDWLGYHEGCGSGAGSLAAPFARGLSGVVVDGGWRDVAELRAREYPVFGRGEAVFSPPKREPGEINVPICCGGVVVEPGDVIVAGEGGVAVVPRRHLVDVVDAVTGMAPESASPPPGGLRPHEEVFKARRGLRG
jgi:4-hydroxy-4-methyl-2-oxoglutarate aldolase